MFEKYDNVDTMFDEIKSKIIKEVESAQRATIEQLTEENENLKKTNKWLLKASKRADREQDNFKLFSYLVYRFKQKIQYMDNLERDRAVYEFLDVFFTKDFTENTYDCPLWLGCVVQYYSNRDTVVKVLRMLDIAVPTNIDSFRLPHDWTTDELDIFFDTMNKHYVCNGCIYEDNLRFWKPNALDSVYDVCYNNGSYTQIPWQFLLRNPNLLNEKYLKRIGKMAFENYNRHWSYFFKIQQYQELTPEQIKLIITNMNEDHIVNSKSFQSVNEFLMGNAEHIPEGPLLESFYKCFNDSYGFKYADILLKLPVKYLEDWILNTHEPLDWIKSHKDKLSKEQKNRLLTIVMQKLLEGDI